LHPNYSRVILSGMARTKAELSPDHRARIRRAWRRLEHAESKLERARAAFDEELAELVSAGAGQAAIGRALGLTRSTISERLRGRGEGRGSSITIEPPASPGS
jgi:DNA-binding NarL/FixJ family response regulator